jgi:DNA-binding PadR family transcriptional regulator
MMNQYTDLEIAILEAIREGEGKWSWYGIARQLGGRYEGESRLIYILRDLEQKGLVEEIKDNDKPNKPWKITSEGLKILNTLDDTG